MKNKIFILVISLCLAVPMFAIGTETQDSTVSADVTKNLEVAPDTVKIRFYVENSGINLNDVKEKNDKIVQNAITSIKSNLTNDEQIKTIAFRVNDIYSYKDKIRVFQKYEVINGFEVKLKDLDKISKIIKIAMDSGVKRVDGLSFYIENSDTVCNQLISEAAKAAKIRAEHTASAIGSSISKPKSISPYCSLNSSSVLRKTYAAMNSMDSAGASESLNTIESGTINVNAGVNLIYYLK